MAVRRWILMCLVAVGMTLPTASGQLRTSYDDFNYTIDASAYSGSSYWYFVDKCADQQGWPVTYATMPEYEHIRDWVKNETRLQDKKIWIGLTSYKRERFEWIDSRLKVESFVNELWADPADQDRGNKCVIQEPGGLLRKVHCTGQSAYMMCKIPSNGEALPPITFPDGPCPVGYIKAVDEPDKCYKVITLNHNTGLTFEEAREACRREGPRADLASLQTGNNHQTAELLSLMYERVTGYWLGLERVSGSWQWDDNSPMSYMYLNYYANCGQMVFMDTSAGKPGEINSGDCRLKKGYICQIGAGNQGDPVYTTPVPSSPCPSGYEFYHQACYQIMETPMTWDLADISCASHLVAIHSVNENAYVQMAALAVGQPVWIGLTKSTGSSYDWSNGWLVDYTNFGRSRQSVAYAYKSCVYMKTDGTWFTGSCDQLKYPAVCEIPLGDPVTLPGEVKGLCSSKTELEWYEESGAMCYNATSLASNAGVWGGGWTWLQAMETCLQANPKASLASIPNQAINAHLVNHAREQRYSDKKGIWIGLFRDKNGIFRWLDGSPHTYKNWSPGFPTNSSIRNCAIVNIDDKNGFLWNETECDDKRGFVCMVEKDLVPATPPPTSDSCPDDTWDHYGDDCFLFAANTEELFERAQAACQHYTGAELVSIHNEVENQFIRWYLHMRNAHSQHRSFWIGLTVKAAGDIQKVKDVTMLWQDESPVDYTYFYRDEPRLSQYDDQCVTIDTEHGMWITEPCELRRGFVCRVNKGVYHNRGELSGDALAGVLVGVICLTLVVVVGLFLGTVWLLKKRNKRLTGLPFGIDNYLYGLEPSSSSS